MQYIYIKKLDFSFIFYIFVNLNKVTKNKNNSKLSKLLFYQNIKYFT